MTIATDGVCTPTYVCMLAYGLTCEAQPLRLRTNLECVQYHVFAD